VSFYAEAHHYIAQYGYAAVGLGILLENFGLPTPGETLLITGAVAAARGALDIRLLLLVAWLGAFVGNTIGYYIGWWGGHSLLVRYGARVGITQQRLDWVTRYFQRYGDAVILFSRFFLGLRQLSGIVAGSLQMRLPRFLVLNAIGSALWVGFWGLLADWLGGHIFHIFRAKITRAEPLVIGLGIAAVIIAVALHFFGKRLKNHFWPPPAPRDTQDPDRSKP
jgi:membrane protein DedA with SNARE-associated domain